MSNSKSVMKATVSGTFWNYGIFAASKGLVFISTIILARILAPDDFGLLALGLLAINYLDTLSDFGVGAALVYRQEDPAKSANVAFTLSVVTGLLLTAAAIVLAPLAGEFFREPRVVPIIRVLSLSFLISAFGSIQQWRIRKEMDFQRRVLPEVGRTFLKGGISVLFALLGFGVWSLVWGQLAGVLGGTILYWWVSPRGLRFDFDRKISRQLLGYGSQMILVGLLGMLHNNADYLIIGRRMSSADLGFYTIAFRIPELIIMNLCFIVSQALFPAYAKLQDNPAALRSGFLSSLSYVSLLTVPIGVGLYLVSPEFILLFYTDRWAPAIPVMQLLSLYALIYSLSFNSGDVYKATGRPAILNQLAVVKLAITLPVLWIAAGHGILYVALGQALVTLLLTFVRLGVASRIIAVRPWEIWQALRPALVGGAVMLGGTLLLRFPLDSLQQGAPLTALPPVARLLLLMVVASLLYVATLWLIQRPLLLKGLALLRGRLSGGPLRRWRRGAPLPEGEQP